MVRAVGTPVPNCYSDTQNIGLGAYITCDGTVAPSNVAATGTMCVFFQNVPPRSGECPVW